MKTNYHDLFMIVQTLLVIRHVCTHVFKSLKLSFHSIDYIVHSV